MDKEEKKKDYGFMGTVTISTEEYRDLIEDRKNLEAKLSDVSKEKSDYYWEKYHLKQEPDELKPKYENFVKFINEVDGVKDKYKLWKLEQVGEDE